MLHIPAVFSKANTLPASGVVNQSGNGYVFLSVSPRYVTDLYPLIASTLTSIPCLKKNNNHNGAHISLFYPHAKGANPALLKAFLKQRFTFKVIGLYSIRFKRQSRRGVSQKTYIALEVTSPALVQSVKTIQATNKHVNHLHITIALAKSKNGVCSRR